MDKRTDSMASQLNLANRDVISLFFLRNGKVMVLNTDYTVIVPG